MPMRCFSVKSRWLRPTTDEDSSGPTSAGHDNGEMNVIDHSPHAWYLLEDGDEFLLDVNCSQSAFSFGFTLSLSTAEREAYQQRGPEALDELGRAIQDSAPMWGPASSPYADRNVDKLRGTDVAEAIRRWRKETESER